jgi:hypothetical protein
MSAYARSRGGAQAEVCSATLPDAILDPPAT